MQAIHEIGEDLNRIVDFAKIEHEFRCIIHRVLVKGPNGRFYPTEKGRAFVEDWLRAKGVPVRVEINDNQRFVFRLTGDVDTIH